MSSREGSSSLVEGLIGKKHGGAALPGAKEAYKCTVEHISKELNEFLQKLLQHVRREKTYTLGSSVAQPLGWRFVCIFVGALWNRACKVAHAAVLTMELVDFVAWMNVRLPVFS